MPKRKQGAKSLKGPPKVEPVIFWETSSSRGRGRCSTHGSWDEAGRRGEAALGSVAGRVVSAGALRRHVHRKPFHTVQPGCSESTLLSEKEVRMTKTTCICWRSSQLWGWEGNESRRTVNRGCLSGCCTSGEMGDCGSAREAQGGNTPAWPHYLTED